MSPRDGVTIDPRALVMFLIPRMPYFMVPRFIRVLPDLPKTMSDKVRKQEILATIDIAECWDRVGEGIALKS